MTSEADEEATAQAGPLEYRWKSHAIGLLKRRQNLEEEKVHHGACRQDSAVLNAPRHFLIAQGCRARHPHSGAHVNLVLALLVTRWPAVVAILSRSSTLSRCASRRPMIRGCRPCPRCEAGSARELHCHALSNRLAYAAPADHPRSGPDPRARSGGRDLPRGLGVHLEKSYHDSAPEALRKVASTHHFH